jgi:hypothetical protein
MPGKQELAVGFADLLIDSLLKAEANQFIDRSNEVVYQSILQAFQQIESKLDLLGAYGQDRSEIIELTSTIFMHKVEDKKKDKSIIRDLLKEADNQHAINFVALVTRLLSDLEAKR